MPALVLGIRPIAVIIQLMRSSLLDVLSQDYIKTAYSKGLSTYSVILKHGIKNALNPRRYCDFWVVCVFVGRGSICRVYFWLEGDVGKKL